MPVEKTRSAITRNKHWESIFEMAVQQSYVVVGGEALTFGYESFSDLPGENGRILAFVLLDFGDDGRRGHFRFGAADDSRRTGSHDAAVTRRYRGGRCGGQPPCPFGGHRIRLRRFLRRPTDDDAGDGADGRQLRRRLRGTADDVRPNRKPGGSTRKSNVTSQ